MNVDELRPALATPFPAVVLEIAHQFLLLRVDRYDRFVRRQERRRLRVDVLKLRVAIDVLAAFSCLVVRLQAGAHAAQKLADNPSGKPYDPPSPARSRGYAGCGSSTTMAASDRPASPVRPGA